MKKKVLGLDLGTNSIGWALVEQNFDEKQGNILGIGSRIIPMSQDILGKFDSGQSISQTAERTEYRGVRRLYQRDNLRRERLHRVLNILNFLPEHYKNDIDFDNKFGQFKTGKEPKINYKKNKNGKYKFIFMDSFNEMAKEFEQTGQNTKTPLDWTVYYLRKKALTQKITKEELAWILLNFNQKRGYYQLRGEEVETTEGKEKTFEILVGGKVIENGDKLKKTGEPLHDLYFTNGWKYDKPVAKPEIWLNRKKEFIVTTSTTKSGEIKRTYKAVDSEKDWIAIKEKAQKDIDSYNEHNKTIGVANYIYNTLLQNPTQKIRGKLIKTIERKYYKQELQAILKKQEELQCELFTTQKYTACIEELYPRNEAHKRNIREKGFQYLFVDDIIFYQRPLKSKKSTISGCQYEYRTFQKFNKETCENETVKEYIKAISKSHPLFQEFRLWQFLKNLKIYKKEDSSTGKLKLNVDVTDQFLPDENAWTDLFDFLNQRKEVEQKQIIQHFISQKIIPKTEKDAYRWNYVEDKKYPANETLAQFNSRLSKVEAQPTLSKEQAVNLWHIIYSVKDKQEFKTALGTFAEKNQLDKESFVNAFKKFPPFKSDYGAYSEKALKKILPLMRRGKYWKEEDIPQNIKDRVAQYMERVDGLNLPENATNEQINKAFEHNQVTDDDIPRQLVKSFIPFKDKNPLTTLNTYQACYAVYERHSEASEITKWKKPEDIDNYLQKFKQHSLRNPIVEQVITETLRTVRDIWQKFGDFNEIHVELGREMKNPADKRKQMTQRISENENTNKRIKEILKELMSEGVENVKSYSPSHQEILKIYEDGIVSSTDNLPDEIEKIRKNANPSKSDITRYKLWLEQGYISPYTGETIPLSSLFTTKFQIEHVIPQSRYFDDSLSNKIICESEVNALKSNQTAYEFIKNNPGQLIELQQGKTVKLFSLEAYEVHCNRYFKSNRAKLKKLLSEDIPEGFIERQMNDSRYISKVIKSLLSNIVREDGEQEATSKNLVTLTGSITSKLKQDWGLNNQWNKLILPRFKRLNQLTGRNDFTALNSNNIEIPNIPDDIGKVEKKRLDHRHHALDALVIACTTKDHVNYITSLNTQRKNHALVKKLRYQKDVQKVNKETGEISNYKVATNYKKPWETYTNDAKNALDKTIVSFKQNLRVINRTNNKTWQWLKQKNGSYKKELVSQKGKNFAIRKPMHKETVSGLVKVRDIKTVSLNSAIDGNFIFVDKPLNKKVKSLRKKGYDNKTIKKHFKDLRNKFNEKNISKVKVYYFIEATATRTVLTEKFTPKQLDKVTDSGIKRILGNHAGKYLDDKGKPQFNLAFSPEGIEDMNKNIQELNAGKKHKPIYSVRLYEAGSKFAIGDKGVNASKYVEAAKGTNLFFAVYWNPDKQKREYETVPLNEVIEHQKQNAKESKKYAQTSPIPLNADKGEFLFSLSPNDLVYVPTDEEKENPSLVDFKNLTKEQINRIYKMVSTTKGGCHFTPYSNATEIIKNENGTNSKSERIQDYFNNQCFYDNKGKPVMIKERCWKLKVNRLGELEGFEGK